MNLKFEIAFASALILSVPVGAEMMNAQLKFEPSADIVQAGKAFCLKTEVVQTGGDTLVLEPYDVTRLQQAKPSGEIAPCGECVSGAALTEMKELEFDFSLATAGTYETWVRAWFPTADSYNHHERMDGGETRCAWDSSVRRNGGDEPMSGKFLEPKTWHWVRNYTYDLAAGKHAFLWPANGAWCGGCRLDRVVLVRKGIGIRPEDVRKDNRRVARPRRATVLSRPVRLDALKAWSLEFALSAGGGSAAFERSTDDGAAWSPVESGKAYSVDANGSSRLLLRLTLAAGPEGGLQPVVYFHQFRIERKVGGADMNKLTMAAALAAGTACAGILPQRIVPNKIIYEVGEKGWADVFVTNTSAKALTADLAIEDIWGLGLPDERRTIATLKVECAPHAGKSLRVDWPGSAHRYGHELKVTVRDRRSKTDNSAVQPSTFNLQPLSSRSEYFNVIDDWWRVFQGMDVELERGEMSEDTRHLSVYYGFAPDALKGEFQGCYVRNVWESRLPGWGPFLGYGNTFMRWHVSESSVGGNYHPTTYPQDRKWINSQGTWRHNGNINADTRAQHARGVKHLHFTINLMEGPGGIEIGRRHPEWVMRTARGQLGGNYASSDPMKLADNTQQYIHWSYFDPDFFRDDCFEWAIADLKKGVEVYNEDGVYFDGRYLPRKGYDFEGHVQGDGYAGKDVTSESPLRRRVLKSIRRTQEMLVGPDGKKRFVWSSDIPRPESPCTATFDHPQVGALTEVQWAFLLSPSMSVSNYRGFYDFLLPGRNRCYWPSAYAPHPSRIFATGFLSPAWMGRKPVARHSWTMCNHIMAIVNAAAAHPFAGGLSMRPFKQMDTRYSEFLWHEDIELPKNGYRHFVCDSLREVWFDDAIYRRETPTHTDWYIHLVNTPEKEQCDEKVEADPPAVDDAVVSTKLFAAKDARAWAIQPYGHRPAKYEPTCVPVPVKSVRGETAFSVPPFRYYTLLVIRVDRR